jgi:hypothetical protein
MSLMVAEEPTRLRFSLCVYLLPALLAVLQPQNWWLTACLLGAGAGGWRAWRRRLRWECSAVHGVLAALLASLVGAVSSLLGWICLPCWMLVAVDQS